MAFFKEVAMKIMNKHAISIILSCSALVLSSHNAFAQKQGTTLRSNTIIATWQPKHALIATFDDAEKALSESRYLDATGAERERVTRFTKTMRSQYGTLSPGQQKRLVLLEARLLQGVHKFEQAKQHLEQINYARLPSVHLLLSDISIQQGNAEKAKEFCEKLVGQTSFLVAFTCMVNASFSQSMNIKLFNKLKAFETFASNARPTERQWFYEVLADMSLQLGDAESAIDYLNKTAFNKLPISALLVWIDAHAKLGKFNIIISTLERNINDISKTDDSLLLKWAKAERALGLNSSRVQSQLAKNMEIRVWREDSSHAAQVAIYFLDLAPNYTQALKFAKLNWQYAQTSTDKQLLERAIKIHEAHSEV